MPGLCPAGLRLYYYGPMFRFLVILCGAAAFPFAADSSSDALARGKYLVEEVGKCQECHTPRLETGELDKTKWLQGAEFNFQPIKDVKGWHKTSPNLTPAGKLWARWGEAGLTKFMEPGAGPKGNPADPPMPAYKLTHADAEAV